MEEGDFDQRLRDLQREYLEFLDDEEDQGIYKERVVTMIADNSQRLVVNVNDLRRKNPERAKNLLENAFEEQIAFQRALKDYVSSIDPVYAKQQEEFFVAFSGSFGNKHVTPRSLTSKYLGNLICVEGIVTRVSLVRPKVVRSVHYCPATKKVMERKYTDLTSFEAFPTNAVYPTKDDEGNPLETEYGLSRYKDHQTLTVQEMPERAPAGQLPRSVDIVCDDDLVDKCKPGDRVQVVGNYRCLPNKQGSFTAGTFRTILIANNVTQINKDLDMTVTMEDIRLCKRLAKRKTIDIFDLLGTSLAPSIHGHDYIKKAILCLLLGGMEKILPNGTRLRGDINVLLIGDPSVAQGYLFFIIQYIFGKDEGASNANKEVMSSDESIIVNKEGLNEASDSEKKYQRNERVPPKNLKKLTLSQVAQQAKDDGLGSVAVLAVYAKDSALHRLPETVLQVAEKDLENNTKTDVQHVDYGADLEGYTQDSKEEEEENTNNENKDNKDSKEDDNASNDDPKTSEGQQSGSGKN